MAKVGCLATRSCADLVTNRRHVTCHGSCWHCSTCININMCNDEVAQWRVLYSYSALIVHKFCHPSWYLSMPTLIVLGLGKANKLHKVISRFDIALNLILVISRSGSTSMIDLVPSMTVMETKTDFVIPSFSSLMSSFGGALGLWLGLGIIQLVQVSDNYDHYYCHDHVMSICGH